MDAWKPDHLLKALLIWSACTFIAFWLPAVRGLMDGPSYSWGSFGGLGESGTAGDYWFPALGSVLAICFLYLGWRGARSPFKWLLLAWHGFLAIGSIRLALVHPDAFRFRGDTLGIDVSLAWVGPVLFGGFALLSVVWAVRDKGAGRGEHLPSWNERNTGILLRAVGMIPFQLALLRLGQPHGTTDQLGVLLILAQWAILNAALYPWRSGRGADVHEAARDPAPVP